MSKLNLHIEATKIVSALGLNLELNNVFIKYVPFIATDEQDHIVRGQCYHNKAGDICIEVVEGMGKMRTKLTLAHELKHAEQYQSKRLENIFGALKGWEGGLVNMTKVNYLDQPWEVEARVAAKEYEELLITNIAYRIVSITSTILNMF